MAGHAILPGASTSSSGAGARVGAARLDPLDGVVFFAGIVFKGVFIEDVLLPLPRLRVVDAEDGIQGEAGARHDAAEDRLLALRRAFGSNPGRR